MSIWDKVIIYNVDDPTPELIKEWGYNDDAHLTEQDEDLCLYDEKYLPVLTELANDEKCPKSYYAFSIIEQFCRESALSHNIKIIQNEYNIINRLGEAKTEDVVVLHQYLQRLINYFEFGAIPANSRIQMSKDLILGLTRVGDIIETKRIVNNYHEYELKLSHYSEYIYINATSGKFKVSKYNTLAEKDLE
jgi:hypothetical protein